MSAITPIQFVRMVLRPYKAYVIGLVWVGIVCAIDLAVSPYCLKQIIDKLQIAHKENVMALVGPWVTLYLVIVILTVAHYRLHDWLRVQVLPNLRQTVIQSLVDGLLKQSHVYYQSYFAGMLANKLNDVADGLRALLEVTVDRFVPHTLMLFGACIMAYTVQPIFAGILWGWAILFVGIAFVTSGQAHELSEVASEANSQLTGKIVDLLGNMTMVRAFAHEWLERRHVRLWTAESALVERRLLVYVLKVWLVQGMLFVLLMVVTFVSLISGWRQGLVTAGDFAMILTLVISVSTALWSFAQDFSLFTQHSGRLTQGLKVLTQVPSVVDVSGAQPLEITQGVIEFQNVHFQYQDQEPIFSDKSICIEGGQKVGLVGYSGSGKSTFVSLILRLYDLNSGCIRMDGQDISQVAQSSLRKKIGIVSQDPILFNRTLFENIAYGQPGATRDAVIEAAKKAHAHEFIQEMPQQYETMVGDRGLRLSGGQRQRIAIARAILKNAPILILDEATSAMDSITERLIQESLWELMQDKTTLVIAHRLSTLLHMDRILVFDSGRIVEDGSHNALLAQNGVYARLWSSQVGGFLRDEDLKQ